MTISHNHARAVNSRHNIPDQRMLPCSIPTARSKERGEVDYRRPSRDFVAYLSRVVWTIFDVARQGEGVETSCRWPGHAVVFEVAGVRVSKKSLD